MTDETYKKNCDKLLSGFSGHRSRLASPKLLRLRKIQIYLVFHSTFRNFGFAEVTRHSEMKRKLSFLLHFSRFYRNFALKMKKGYGLQV